MLSPHVMNYLCNPRGDGTDVSVHEVYCVFINMCILSSGVEKDIFLI